MKSAKKQKNFEANLKKSEENKEMQKEIKRKIMPIEKIREINIGPAN